MREKNEKKPHQNHSFVWVFIFIFSFTFYCIVCCAWYIYVCHGKLWELVFIVWLPLCHQPHYGLCNCTSHTLHYYYLFSNRQIVRALSTDVQLDSFVPVLTSKKKYISINKIRLLFGMFCLGSSFQGVKHGKYNRNKPFPNSLFLFHLFAYMSFWFRWLKIMPSANMRLYKRFRRKLFVIFHTTFKHYSHNCNFELWKCNKFSGQCGCCRCVLFFFFLLLIPLVHVWVWLSIFLLQPFLYGVTSYS